MHTFYFFILFLPFSSCFGATASTLVASDLCHDRVQTDTVLNFFFLFVALLFFFFFFFKAVVEKNDCTAQRLLLPQLWCALSVAVGDGGV